MDLKRVVVLGGSGFLGQQVVAQLAARGLAVRVPARRRERAKALIVLPTVEVVQADPTAAGSLDALLAGADAVVNLIGILNAHGEDSFERVHTGLARELARVCRARGIRRLVHVSALGAAADAPSAYLRSKAAAETALRDALSGSLTRLDVLRPSLLMGASGGFLGMMAQLAAWSPVIPLACPRARFQPILVEDVARAVLSCLLSTDRTGATLELGGPEVFSLEELVRMTLRARGLCRMVLPLGSSLAALQAAVLERLPGRLLTRDNLASMRVDNVCTGPFPAALGFQPEPVTRLLAAPADDVPHRYDRFRAQARR